MKIALICRAAYGARNAFAHLLSALRKHASRGVKVVVVKGDPLPVARRLEEKGYRPAVLYSISTATFVALYPEIRAVASRHTVVIGGPHAAGAFWQVLRAGAELAVVGDGEPVMPVLVEYLSGEVDASEVPNVAYREDGRFKVTRIVLANLDDYEPYSLDYEMMPPIEIMRGCWFRCAFCQTPSMFKGVVRFRSVESVLRAVRVYVDHGKKDIRFVAPVGLGYMSSTGREPNVEALEELLSGVRRLGGRPYLGTFPSETRPELVTRESLRVLRSYAENRRLAIGMQSGSNKVLKKVVRGHTVEEALTAVEVALKEGFKPVVDLILGLPGEDEADVEETVKVMYKLAESGVRMRLHTFMPLPGSPLAYAPPGRLCEAYQRAVFKLLGRGVLEGDWEEQEKLAEVFYCIMRLDPKPTPERCPLEDTLERCGTTNLDEYVLKARERLLAERVLPPP